MFKNSNLYRKNFHGFWFVNKEFKKLKDFNVLKKMQNQVFFIVIHLLTVQNNGNKYLQVMATKLLMC
jgi:hypothetical protein